MVFLKTAHTMILLQTVVVCPGTHILKNHESLSRTNECQLKKKKTWSSKLNQLNQTFYLKADAKTIYYSILKFKYSPSIYLEHKKA